MIFFLGLSAALITVFLPIAFTSLILIVLLGILIGLLIYVKKTSEEDIFLSSLFLLSFLSKVMVSLLLYNLIFLRNGTGLLGDGWSFSESGYSILQLWLGGMRDMNEIVVNTLKVTTSGNLGSYDFWNAIVYYFTDKSPLSLIFINCLVSSLTAILIYYITKQLYNIKAAKISAILTAFWPSLFIWSVQNLKEPLSIFLMALIIWAVLLLKKKFRFYLLFIIVLSSIALKELRIVSFFMFYAVIFPFSLILFLWKKNRVLFIFLILLAGIGLPLLIKEYLTHQLNHQSLLEYINYMRTARAYGSTAVLPNFSIAKPAGFISFAPLALLIAWLAPFPWQIGSMSQIASMPEMLLYYLLLPAMFLGLRFVMKHKIREGGVIVVYIFIMMLVLAFIEGNVGTLFRHRAMVLPFMFILIGIGLDEMNFKITIHN